MKAKGSGVLGEEHPGSLRFSNLLRVIIQLKYISGKRILEARLIDLRILDQEMVAAAVSFSLKSLGILLEMVKYPEKINYKAISMDCRVAYHKCGVLVPTFRRGRERDVERKKKAISLDRVDAPFNTGLPGQKHQTQKGNGNKSVQNMGRIARGRRQIWV